MLVVFCVTERQPRENITQKKNQIDFVKYKCTCSYKVVAEQANLKAVVKCLEGHSEVNGKDHVQVV